jgi:hypothetical protein
LQLAKGVENDFRENGDSQILTFLVVGTETWGVTCGCFGSALNLNIHFRMLFLEGAISENTWGGTNFTRIKAPTNDDMVILVQHMYFSPPQTLLAN